MARPKLPSYRLHKATGQAVVTLNGRDHYLGRHGTEVSRAAYDRLTAAWIARGRRPEPEALPAITVAGLLVAYWRHAEVYYRKGGKATSQLSLVRLAGRDLRKAHGSEPAREFSPKKLRELRDSWAGTDTRAWINKRLGIIRAIFAWGATEGLVQAEVAVGLKLVPWLARGRSTARELPPVLPVPEDALAATLARLRPRWRAMAELQLWTGMRPGEVCGIRPMDVDRSGDVWIYTPGSHKTEHRGRSRAIPIGPRGRAILGPWLAGKDPGRHAFRLRRADGPIDRDEYARAIAEACKRAGVAHWHPNQLRHNAATRIRREHGVEVARVILGHSQVATTEIYAEADRAKADDAARQSG